MKSLIASVLISISLMGCDGQSGKVHGDDWKKAEYSCSLHGGVDYAWESSIGWKWNAVCNDGTEISRTITRVTNEASND